MSICGENGNNRYHYEMRKVICGENAGRQVAKYGFFSGHP